MRCVLFVDADILVDLVLSFLRKDRRRALLKDVGDTVRLGRAVAHPHCIQCEPASHEFLRDDGVAEARPRKSCRLGERADLNGAGLCSLDLKDAVRDLRILDERLVGGIKEDDRIGFVRVIHPCPQMCAREDCTRRIVRRADVDDVGMHGRIGQGQKAVLAARCGMDDLISCNDVRIDVGRIRGLHDENALISAEDVEDVAQLIACTARNEHILGSKLHTAPRIVRRNRRAQLRCAAFGHIAVKALLHRLIIHGVMQRVDNRAAERQGHIADAHAVEMRAGMFGEIRLGLLRDVVEQVGVLQPAVVHIRCHAIPLSIRFHAYRFYSLFPCCASVMPDSWKCCEMISYTQGRGFVHNFCHRIVTSACIQVCKSTSHFIYDSLCPTSITVQDISPIQ